MHRYLVIVSRQVNLFEVTSMHGYMAVEFREVAIFVYKPPVDKLMGHEHTVGSVCDNKNAKAQKHGRPHKTLRYE